MIRILIPNEITYGASLDRMSRKAPPERPAAPRLAQSTVEKGAMIVVRGRTPGTAFR